MKLSSISEHGHYEYTSERIFEANEYIVLQLHCHYYRILSMNIKWDYIIIGNLMILYCKNSQTFIVKKFGYRWHQVHNFDPVIIQEKFMNGHNHVQ